VLTPQEAGPAGGDPLATAFFAAPVGAGAWVLAWVEALSALGLAGSRTAWAVFWAATAAASAAGLGATRRAARARPPKAPRAAALAVPCAVLGLTLVVALAAAPNNWDSLVYHNARVVNWWDHGTVAAWETPIDRQVRMPPLASYFKLALLGLTGNDVLFNLVQWAFFAFSIVAAGILAARLVPSDRAGPWAALLVATTVMAVLQATSTQNDVVVAGYLLSASFFLARASGADGGPVRDLALSGAAIGLACATKGTAYLLAMPLAGAAAWAAASRIARGPGRERRAWAAGLAAAAALVVLPSAGFWWRNARAFGSPVGSAYEVIRPSAFLSLGPGKAPALAVSQVLRAAVLQLGQLRVVGARGRNLVAGLRQMHGAMGVGVDEPAISGPLPLTSAEWPALNHEDTAPSTGTFLVLAAATGIALVTRSLRKRRAVLAAFAAGWAAWLLVAVFVRWMPWNARLQLPAIILLAVPAGAVVAEVLGRVPRAVLASVLVVQALPALLLNSSRPLVGVSTAPEDPVFLRTLVPRGSRSVLTTSRWEDYFRNQPPLQVEVEDLLREVAHRCGPGGTVQLALSGDSPEYVLWAGRRRFAPGVRLHAGEPRPGDPAPCAVVRAACPGGRTFCLGGSAP
jgi:hypothetical protein